MAEVYLGIGSNVQREKHIHNCLLALQQTFGVIEKSCVYQSAALGFAGDDFYNLVVKITTGYSLVEIVRFIKELEDANGRIRTAPRFSPRTLDVDLLLYDNLVGTFNDVVLPRDEILTNAFVLFPLADIAPDKYHPVLKKRYRELRDNYDDPNQRLKKIAFS